MMTPIIVLVERARASLGRLSRSRLLLLGIGLLALGGIAIALPGGVSLLGSIGILQGERGHRAVGSSGASLRF